MLPHSPGRPGGWGKICGPQGLAPQSGDSKRVPTRSPLSLEGAPKQRPPKTRDDADPCDSAPSKAPPQNHPYQAAKGRKARASLTNASSILCNRLAFARLLASVRQPLRAWFNRTNSSFRFHARLSTVLPWDTQGGGFIHYKLKLVNENK